MLYVPIGYSFGMLYVPLVIALVLECLIWSPQEEDLHMVLEFLLEMVQDKQVKWSWSLQSIMASIYEISP